MTNSTPTTSLQSLLNEKLEEELGKEVAPGVIIAELFSFIKNDEYWMEAFRKTNVDIVDVLRDGKRPEMLENIIISYKENN